MEFNRAQLKRSVRQVMKSTRPNPMVVALLFSVVVSVGTWLINTVLGFLLTGGSAGNFGELYLRYLQTGYDVEEAMEQALLAFLSQGPGNIFAAVVGGSVLSILAALWQSSMNVGYEGWCLSMVRREFPPMNKIFAALPQFGPVLLTRFLTGLFELLWSLLVVLGYAVLFLGVVMAAALTESVVLTVLLALAAVVYLTLGIIWVSMRYVLVDYVLIDKGLSGMEAIRENKRLMKGNIGRAFLLQLSFIGWYLLALAIVYGGIILAVAPIIGAMNSPGGLVAASGFAVVVAIAAVAGTVVLSLWLRPYVTGSMAKFYDWACGRPEPLSGGSDGWSGQPDYTWNAGPSSGGGTGAGPRNDAPAPKPPKPRDDPWN